MCWKINLPLKGTCMIQEGESVHVFMGDAAFGSPGCLDNFPVCLVVNISVHVFIALILSVKSLFCQNVKFV